ncbi:TniQ family protein [Leisingera sp. S132]|nr:TniQ family protein [Leisingera sp. S132]
MSTLRPYIPFDLRETLLSYAARLSAVHTGKGMRRLLNDLRIPVENFLMGRHEAVEAFASATGSDAEILKSAALTGKKNHVEFRGAKMSKTFVVRQADKYCPVCLAEDGSPYAWRQQLIWCFAPAHRCVHHNTSLRRITQKGFDLRDGLVAPGAGAVTPCDGDQPEYLAWLDNRLHGPREEPKWLTGQTVQQVLETSMMMGAVLEHGHKVRPHKLRANDQEAAADIGFAIYREGAGAVTEALDTIRRRSPATAVQAGPLAKYGPLFDWLDRRCNAIDPGPVRDLLRNHIIKHDALSRGDTVLGYEIRERRYHSVHSLSEETSIPRVRMSRMLQKLGKIPAGATHAECGLLRFDAQEITGLIADFQTAIEMKDVPAYIGASKNQFQTLYAGGIIRPLVPRDKPGAVRNVAFSRRHLDTFLETLNALPVASETGKELQTIAYACQRGAGTTLNLVYGILSGEIPAWRRDTPPGLSQVLVSLTDAVGAE